MKKSFTVLFIILISVFTKAQLNEYPLPDQGRLEGGLGLNWIDGQLYYTFHFTPEVSFSNFGVGLDLMLDFDKNGNIRKENFNTFSDYLSVIRYVRYGFKSHPLYAKLGALDYYTLGHGSIMYAYNNSPTIDARKQDLYWILISGISDLNQSIAHSLKQVFSGCGVTYVRFSLLHLLKYL